MGASPIPGPQMARHAVPVDPGIGEERDLLLRHHHAIGYRFPRQRHIPQRVPAIVDRIDGKDRARHFHVHEIILRCDGVRHAQPKASFAGVSYKSNLCGEYDQNQHPVEVAPEAKQAHANDRKIWNAYLRNTYDAGIMNISALTTYTKVTQVRYDDFYGFRDGIPFNLTPGPGTIDLYINFGSNSNVKGFSQELRFSGKSTKRFAGTWAVITRNRTMMTRR